MHTNETVIQLEINNYWHPTVQLLENSGLCGGYSNSHHIVDYFPVKSWPLCFIS